MDTDSVQNWNLETLDFFWAKFNGSDRAKIKALHLQEFCFTGGFKTSHFKGKGRGGWVTWPLEVFPPLFLKVNKQDTNSKVSGYGIPHPSMIDYCMVGFA